MPTDTGIRNAEQQLRDAGRRVVDRGLVQGSGGNLSARVDDGSFLITASGTWLDVLGPDGFSLLDLDGRVVSGSPRPSSEWKLHQRLYARHPDVRAVVHLHPQYSLLMTAAGLPIRLLTLDHRVYVGSTGVVPFHPNGSDELADTAAAAADAHPCVIMANHGCSVVASTVEMALRRALNLEEAAAMSYRAALLNARIDDFAPDDLGAVTHR